MNKLFKVFTLRPTYVVAADEEEAVTITRKSYRWKTVRPRVIDDTESYYTKNGKVDHDKYVTELLPTLQSGFKGEAYLSVGAACPARWLVNPPRPNSFIKLSSTKPPGADINCTHCGYTFDTSFVNSKGVCGYCRKFS